MGFGENFLQVGGIFVASKNREDISMKIFLDTANIDEICSAKELGLLDGVTTNPTLLAKEGKDPEKLLKEIVELVDGPVSLEVVSTDTDGMLREARKLKKFGDNVVIKIPLTQDGLKSVSILEKEGIPTNVTLCFSPLQALLVAKAGASYVSPFVGRLDDISSDGMRLIEDIIEIYENYDFSTEVIVASVRHPMHILWSAKIGADICTIPYKVLLQLIKHPLTDIGIQRFLSDWDKLNKKLSQSN